MFQSIPHADAKDRPKAHANANNSPTNVNSATDQLVTNTLGAAPEVTGRKVDVLAGGSVGATGSSVGDAGRGGFEVTTTVELVVCVTASTWGIVNVTTDEPFCPHLAQLCVSVVRGTTAGAVPFAGQYVIVTHVVTTCSDAGLVAHTVVYVTVRVRVTTPFVPPLG